MATPILEHHLLPGALGEILIDIRAPSGPAPRPAVVIMHGFKGFKDWGMFPALADRLARAGFTAVSLNASGSGVDGSGTFVWPKRFGHNTFSLELADIAAVLAALDEGRLGVPRPTSIGMVGHSRGGGMAVLTAGRTSRVQALVTWAAISTVRRWDAEQAASWRAAGVTPVVNQRTGETYSLYLPLLDDVERNASGSLDIQGAAARLRIPWLIAHGTGDETVPFREAEELTRAAPSASSLLLAVPDATHTFGAVHPFAGSTPDLELVSDETVRWLARHLP